MPSMEQLWLLLSLTSLVSGFGLVVALLFLKRLAPVTLPPVLTAMLALLIMGVASLTGVYLRVISLPRSLLFYRLLNAFAWGFGAYAMSRFVQADRHLGADSRLTTSTAIPPLLGIVVLLGAFVAAHPPADGGVLRSDRLQAFIMTTIEAVVSLFAIWTGVRALRRARSTSSRPWRAYLRGFGIALLLLIPANLLDFSVTVALRLSGSPARDGFVFAAGYGIANVVLIISIVRGIRLTGSDVPPAIPRTFVDAFGITPREREVIEKLLDGKSDRQIAEELFISPRTVDTHLRSIFRKCQVSSRLHLTRLVSSYGELRNSP